MIVAAVARRPGYVLRIVDESRRTTKRPQIMSGIVALFRMTERNVPLKVIDAGVHPL
jgi:hypothetical protein